jgi:hypothetical protein
MILRTYTRVLVNNIFKPSFLIGFSHWIVNFYYKLWFKKEDSLKFSDNNPTVNMKNKCNCVFRSVTGDEIKVSSIK